MARGRPKKHHTEKGQKRTLSLDPEASYIEKQMRKKRLRWNLSQYVSECLKRDYSQVARNEDQLLEMKSREKAQEIKKLWDEIEDIKNKRKKLQERELNREADQILKKHQD